MLRRWASRVTALFLGCLLSLLVSVQATAAVDCQMLAASTTSASLALPTSGEWHLRQSDSVSIYALAASPQSSAKVAVNLFGVAIPIWAPHFKASRSFESGTVRVSDYAGYARVVRVSAETNSCRTSTTLTIDDTNALLTVAGASGAIVGLISLLLLTLLARGRPTVKRRIWGMVLGLIFGLGVGLLAQQTGILDPGSIAGLGFPAIALVLGAAVPGALHKMRPDGVTPTPLPEREAAAAAV